VRSPSQPASAFHASALSPARSYGTQTRGFARRRPRSRRCVTSNKGAEAASRIGRQGLFHGVRMVRQRNVTCLTFEKCWHVICFISIAPATHTSHAGLARGTGTVNCVLGQGRESRGRLPAKFFWAIACRNRDAFRKKADARRVFRNRGDPLEPGAGRRTVVALFAPCRITSQCDVVCQSRSSSAQYPDGASDGDHSIEMTHAQCCDASRGCDR
jgi:hypothetical protein